MNRKMLRAGIIGSGFAARFHYEALQRVFTANVEVAGVYSRSVDNMQAFTNGTTLKVYESLGALIEDVDVVHVCTPPVTHEPFVIAALQQDCHVIVEKPFTGYFGGDIENFHGDTFSREQGLQFALQSIRRMLDAEKKSRGRIMYAENWVYAPAIQKEKELLEKTG